MGGAVGDGQRVGLAIEGEHHLHRAEDLLLRQPVVGRSSGRVACAAMARPVLAVLRVSGIIDCMKLLPAGHNAPAPGRAA